LTTTQFPTTVDPFYSAQNIREKTTLTVRVQHLQALLLESQSVIAEQQEVIRGYEDKFGEVRDVLRGNGVPVSFIVVKCYTLLLYLSTMDSNG
jgi:hypothetical protein